MKKNNKAYLGTVIKHDNDKFFSPKTSKLNSDATYMEDITTADMAIYDTVAGAKSKAKVIKTPVAGYKYLGEGRDVLTPAQAKKLLGRPDINNIMKDFYAILKYYGLNKVETLAVQITRRDKP